MYILRTRLFTKPKFYDLLDLILHAAVIAGILLLMLGPNVDGPLCGEHFDGSIPHNLSHIADGYSLHDTVISGIRPPSSWSESFLECFLLSLCLSCFGSLAQASIHYHLFWDLVRSHKSFRSRYLLPSPSWVVRASRALLWLHLYPWMSMEM